MKKTFQMVFMRRILNSLRPSCTNYSIDYFLINSFIVFPCFSHFNFLLFVCISYCYLTVNYTITIFRQIVRKTVAKIRILLTKKQLTA